MAVTETRVRNGCIRTLCCEGLCSQTYRHGVAVTRMRAAGYSPTEVRMTLTSRMEATSHVESRRMESDTDKVVVVFYTCLVCGHERQYGIEEL